MRLGIFLPNWIGDVAMATPAIRALRKHVGAGELIAIMRPYVAEALGGNPWFDAEILYDKKSSADADLQWPAVQQKLRGANFDAVVLLTNSLRTGWMAYRSGARQRIGTVGNLRSPLLTTRVYPAKQGRRPLTLPPVSGYLQVAYAAGAQPESTTLELFTTPADEQAADAVWRRLNLPAGDRVIVLNTGGAFGAAKDWPTANFTQLALRLAREQNFHVLLNCGPAERQAVRNIVAEARDERITSLADEESLPLGLTKAVIRRSRLLVTTDSGPRFFGVAFGVPTISLFGPTSVEATGTGATQDVGITLGLACQPCMARTCPLSHHRCMRDLSVDRVWSAVAAALAAPSLTLRQDAA
jgi:heptosyltransferase-2